VPAFRNADPHALDIAFDRIEKHVAQPKFELTLLGFADQSAISSIPSF
jgi:hypothetical protein